MGIETSKSATFPVELHLNVDDDLTKSVSRWADELKKFAGALSHIPKAMENAASVGKELPDR